MTNPFIEKTDVETESMAFVPVLTVLPEYGPAFLWIVRHSEERGVGGNLCDGFGWDDSFPMSEGLYHKFIDWNMEFENAAHGVGYVYDFGDDWDWVAFHARGLKLAQWLKEEVGGAYRVVYLKPGEDPNHRIDERREILADGTLLQLPSFRSRIEPERFCLHIVSGGQTGADRGALEFAIMNGYTHGGWAPLGREAEDGVIPVKYQLTEIADGSYRQRTRRNVNDSDASLIVNLGDLEGGSLATRVFADKSGKPCLVVQVEPDNVESLAPTIIGWLQQHDVNTLNVAGPRESKRPGIFRLTIDLLEAVDSAFKSSEQS